jgi:hypothetical protein
MRLILLIALNLLFYSHSFAQISDTAYLDKSLLKTTQENASFTRIAKYSIDSSSQLLGEKMLKSLETFKRLQPDTLDGEAIYYYSNGKLDSKGVYENNERTGVWEFYHETGDLSSKVTFRDGIPVEATCLNSKGKIDKKAAKELLNSPIRTVRLSSIITIENLNRLHDALKGKIKGDVLCNVSFVTDKTGALTDLKMLTGINSEIDRLILKVLSDIRVTPALQYNRPVSVQFEVPLRLRIEG